MYDHSFDWLPEVYQAASARLHWHWRPRANETGVQSLSPEAQQAAARAGNLQHELLKRLDQCRWCLTRVMEIDRDDGSDGSQHDSSGYLAVEIELLSEAFYYFAHRFLDLCENVPQMQLRGVKCRDIRLVRNLLIEHADREGGVTPINFAWDVPGGPQLKPFGSEELPLKSRGLYEHAADMIRALQREMERLGA